MPASTVVYDASGDDGINITFSVGGPATLATSILMQMTAGFASMLQLIMRLRPAMTLLSLPRTNGTAPLVANLESNPVVTLSVIDDPIDTNNSMKVTPTGL